MNSAEIKELIIKDAKNLSDHSFNCPGYYEPKACDCANMRILVLLEELETQLRDEAFYS